LQFYNKIWKRLKEWGCPAWHSRGNELKLRYENRMCRGLKNSRESVATTNNLFKFCA